MLKAFKRKNRRVVSTIEEHKALEKGNECSLPINHFHGLRGCQIEAVGTPRNLFRTLHKRFVRFLRFIWDNDWILRQILLS
jgi:hypothetical protein